MMSTLKGLGESLLGRHPFSVKKFYLVIAGGPCQNNVKGELAWEKSILSMGGELRSVGTSFTIQACGNSAQLAVSGLYCVLTERAICGDLAQAAAINSIHYQY